MRAKRVLIVDDDYVTIDALRALLSNHGYETAACQDGGRALDLVCQGGWDLVILDLGLPSPDPGRVARFDGIKVLQWLGRLHRHVPVLVFTSNEDPEVARQAVEAGAVGVVRKGDPIKQFLQAIEDATRLPAEPESKPPQSTPTTVIWQDGSDRLADS